MSDDDKKSALTETRLFIKEVGIPGATLIFSIFTSIFSYNANANAEDASRVSESARQEIAKYANTQRDRGLDLDYGIEAYRVAKEGFGESSLEKVDLANSMGEQVTNERFRVALFDYIKNSCDRALFCGVEQEAAAVAGLREAEAAVAVLETQPFSVPNSSLDLSEWRVQVLYCDSGRSLELAKDISQFAISAGGASSTLTKFDLSRTDLRDPAKPVTYNFTSGSERELEAAKKLAEQFSRTGGVPAGLNVQPRAVGSTRNGQSIDGHFSFTVCLPEDEQ